jgi:hypothetical protein
MFPIEERNKRINISLFSDGTSEVISYLLTYVLPIVGNFSLSSIISSSSWLPIIINFLIIISVALLFVNSNLIVVNPILMYVGYSLYKIEYNIDNQEKNQSNGHKKSIEGILIASKTFNPEEVDSTLVLDKIDNNIFLYRRFDISDIGR